MEISEGSRSFSLQCERLVKLRKILEHIGLDLESTLEGKIVRRQLLKCALSEIKDALEMDDTLQAQVDELTSR